MIQRQCFSHIDKNSSFTHLPPLKRKSPVLSSSPCVTYSHPHLPQPSSPCPVSSQVSTSFTFRSSPWEIYITLHPATAEDQDSQYVCFTLVLQVPAQVRPLLCGSKERKGRGPGVECLSSNLPSPTSIPTRCQRSLSVIPEDSQMNRSTSKLC